MSLRLLINGAKGRMGQAIDTAADDRFEIVARLDLGDDPQPAMDKAEVAIDFSFHEATPALLAAAAEAGVPVIIGTTGHTDEEREAIEKAATRIPVVYSGNYSIGVNILFHLSRLTATILNEGYDVEVTEIHHRHKRDAPSGTAENLVDALRAGLHHGEEATVRHGRSGITGERPDSEIGVHALRGGEVVGEHTVYFFGPDDRLEITHRAQDRGIFAHGALRAAQWVVKQSPGLYHMRDVLGLQG